MSCSYHEIEALRDELQALADRAPQICGNAARELAARLLRSVRMRTPVGVYNDQDPDWGMPEKVGGTLRRGWTTGEVGSDGSTHTAEVINPVEYAPYVEFGHRQQVGRFVPAIGKRLTKPWAEGRFMLTKSVAELHDVAEQVIDKQIEAAMKGGGKT